MGWPIKRIGQKYGALGRFSMIRHRACGRFAVTFWHGLAAHSASNAPPRGAHPHRSILQGRRSGPPTSAQSHPCWRARGGTSRGSRWENRHGIMVDGPFAAVPGQDQGRDQQPSRTCRCKYLSIRICTEHHTGGMKRCAQGRRHCRCRRPSQRIAGGRDDQQWAGPAYKNATGARRRAAVEVPMAGKIAQDQGFRPARSSITIGRRPITTRDPCSGSRPPMGSMSTPATLQQMAAHTNIPTFLPMARQHIKAQIAAADAISSLHK